MFSVMKSARLRAFALTALLVIGALNLTSNSASADDDDARIEVHWNLHQGISAFG